MFGLGEFEFAAIMAVGILSNVIPWVLLVVVLVLAIRWFLRQEKLDRDPKREAVRKSLAQVIVEHRNACHMTQDFVARELGVSRQAVSKWEAGKSEPSTTNLIALAHLFGMEPADLLREVGE